MIFCRKFPDLPKTRAQSGPFPPRRKWSPSPHRKGQKIARCSTCQVAIWSNYPQAGPAVRFVRVGTIDNPDLCPPDIHIFTSSKQSWVKLTAGAKAVPEFYDLDAVWPAESLERRRLMRAKASQT
jgi:Glutathione-dependent formaldehyde-activating enzyme